MIAWKNITQSQPNHDHFLCNIRDGAGILHVSDTQFFELAQEDNFVKNNNHLNAGFKGHLNKKPEARQLYHHSSSLQIFMLFILLNYYKPKQLFCLSF